MHTYVCDTRRAYTVRYVIYVLSTYYLHIISVVSTYMIIIVILLMGYYIIFIDIRIRV